MTCGYAICSSLRRDWLSRQTLCRPMQLNSRWSLNFFEISHCRMSKNISLPPAKRNKFNCHGLLHRFSSFQTPRIWYSQATRHAGVWCLNYSLDAFLTLQEDNHPKSLTYTLLILEDGQTCWSSVSLKGWWVVWKNHTAWIFKLHPRWWWSDFFLHRLPLSILVDT